MKLKELLDRTFALPFLIFFVVAVAVLIGSSLIYSFVSFKVQLDSLQTNYLALLRSLEGVYKREYGRLFQSLQKELEEFYTERAADLQLLSSATTVVNGTAESKLREELVGILRTRIDGFFSALVKSKKVLGFEEIPLTDEVNWLRELLLTDTGNVTYVVKSTYLPDELLRVFLFRVGPLEIAYRVSFEYFLGTFDEFLSLRRYNPVIRAIGIYMVPANGTAQVARLKHVRGDNFLSPPDEQNILRNLEKFGLSFRPQRSERYFVSQPMVVLRPSRVLLYMFVTANLWPEIGDPIVGAVQLDFSQLFLFLTTVVLVFVSLSLLAYVFLKKRERAFVSDLLTTVDKLIENIRAFSSSKLFLQSSLDFESDIDEVQYLLEEYLKLAQELTATYEEQTALMEQLEASYKEIEASHAELEKSYLQFAAQLAIIAESYDESTGNHIFRVGKVSRFIAEKLQCDEDFAEKIEKFAPLHDIGKVLIPKEILLKNGPLTAEEFQSVKLHTLHGAKLIGDNPKLSIAKNIALYHHEKWDGSGYPFGLRGFEIPLEAQIVAVADVYDALRSERPYKRALPHEESIRILIEGDTRTMPSHFNPAILNVLREFGEEIGKLWDEMKSCSD